MSTIQIPAPKRASADEATVPVPPSTNNLFRGSGSRRFKTREYKDWIDLAGLVMATIRPPEAFPVAVKVRAVGKLNVQRDLDNILKPLGDLLVGTGVLPEDDVRRVCHWQITHEPGPGEPVAVVSVPPYRPLPLSSPIDRGELRELLLRAVDAFGWWPVLWEASQALREKHQEALVRNNKRDQGPLCEAMLATQEAADAAKKLP